MNCKILIVRLKTLLDRVTSRNHRIELTSDKEFTFFVSKLSKKVDEIIETGTYKGTGSTLVFAKTRKPVTTLESNYENFKEARRNLEAYRNVKILNGFSLNRKEMVDFIHNYNFSDVDYGLKIDSFNPQKFYLDEIASDKNIREDLLYPLINNHKKQIILLDSSGGVGYLEFLKVLSLPYSKLSKKILFLDDVDHVKHYRSKKFLERDFLVNVSKSGRWLWTDFTKKRE
jgi:hypothetical protein